MRLTCRPLPSRSASCSTASPAAVILTRTGEIVVAEATPEAYREVSRVQALERGYFTRPSFAGGKVYVRNLADISAIGVTEASAAPSSTERTGADREASSAIPT